MSLIVGNDGSTSSHVHDLMGCQTLASTKSRALTKLRVAIPEYLAWLTSLGDEARMVRRPELLVAEEIRVDDNAGRAGGPDPLLKCDKTPATDRQIRRCLRLLRYTRADLIATIEDLPKRVLSWKPEGEPRSVRNTLRHIAQVDIWYLSRIDADPPLDQTRTRDVYTLLEYSRELVHKQIPRLTTVQRRRVFYPRKWSNEISPWTATKVLHRLVGHERQHTRYLKRILNSPSTPHTPPRRN